ncbi:hypothetical protein MXD81_60170 [Microbacteriaceae bacterium K1510]|nr:hypothetical protein [Microbacteriaceae bacterium K1510]
MMRTLLIKVLAAVAVTAACLTPVPRAEAMTPARIAAAADMINHVEKTRVVRVCRRYWNGWTWITRCHWVNVYSGPYYGAHGPYYYRGYHYRGW